MTIERKNSILTPEQLTPEQIERIKFIVFSKEIKAPFNLTILLDPYIFVGETKERLVRDLLDPSIMVPYYRWQLCRRFMNPLWIKGSGFEGHLIGMNLKKILEILREQERYLIENAKRHGNYYKLNRFINNPDQSISLELAIYLRSEFEIVLAKMRAIRAQLQRQHPENQQFQARVYSTISPFENVFSLNGDNLVIGFAGFREITKNQCPAFNQDIRGDFPYLAEIGRFGFPPLGILFHHLSANHQI